jgi:hypothetical protein
MIARFPLITAALLSIGLASASNTPAAPPEQQAEKALMPFLDLLASPPAGDARACCCQCEAAGQAQSQQ